MFLVRAFTLLACSAALAPAQLTPNCPVLDIQPAGVVEGELFRTDCRITGIMVWESDDTLIRQYRFTVTQPGLFTVDHYSTAYAPSFFLLGPRQNWLMGATDYTQSSHARGVTSLAPGTYTIVVTSWGYATGPYKLTTSFEPLKDCAVRDLKTGVTVNGDFSKPTCRVLDLQVPSTSADGVERFRFAADQRGFLSLNITSTLIESGRITVRLFDSANREITGAVDSSDGLKLTVIANLNPGSYLVEIRGAPWMGTGGYSLIATFEPSSLDACQTQMLRPNGQIDAVLNATGCRFMDLRAGAPDRSITAPFLASISARGVAAFALSSPSTWFVADLLLYDQPGRQIAQKRYIGGTAPAQIFASLEPGSYYVYVRAVGQYVGEFRLKSSFEPVRECAPRAIVPGQAVSGEMSDAGCRVLDSVLPSPDDSPQALWTMKVERRGLLTLEMIATFPLEASLRLLSESGTVLGTAPARGGASNARIQAGLNPGVYTIDARGLGATTPYGRTGPYILKTSFEELTARPCPGRELALNDVVSANLSAGGCRQLDVFAATTSTSPVDPYRITIAAAGVLTIDMVSADLDSYLALYDRDLAQLAADDNGGGGKNARLTVSLNPGAYTILARANDGKTGVYNLTLSFRQPSAAPCPVANLPLVGSVAGALATADCRVLDLVLPSSNTAYVDRYRVTLAQRGVLSLNLVSSSYTPVLTIYDARSVSVGYAYGAGREGASLMASLNPGDYIVFATSSGARTGAYTLVSSFRNMAGARCPVIDIAPGATAQGSLSDTGCRVVDVLVPSSDSSLVSQYRITPGRRSVATLEMESAALDPSVRLYDSQSRSIATSYAQRGSAARVAATVDPAAYLIHAASARPGAFALRTRLEDAPAPDCGPRVLAPGESASGSFTAGGCRVKDILPSSADHSYAAPFKIVLAERGTLAVEMSSSAFRPYLSLYQADFTYVAAGGPVLSAAVPPGEYILLARSAGAVTGAFNLQTTFQAAPPPVCPVKEIGLEETVEGALAAGDCAQRYQVTVTVAGTLEIEITSTDFSPALLLPDSTEGPSPNLRFDVIPGVYEFIVTSSPPGAGRYTLKTAFHAAEGG